MIYIGVDLHTGHFSMAVLNQDDGIIFEETLPTSCQNLKAAIGAFSETKSVVFDVTCPISGTTCYVSPTARQRMMRHKLPFAANAGNSSLCSLLPHDTLKASASSTSAYHGLLIIGWGVAFRLTSLPLYCIHITIILTLLLNLLLRAGPDVEVAISAVDDGGGEVANSGSCSWRSRIRPRAPYIGDVRGWKLNPVR